MSKEAELLALAKKRQNTVYDGYSNIADLKWKFKNINEKFDFDFVSPVSKCAHSIESGVLLILQDWIDEESFNNLNDSELKKLSLNGYADWMVTNKNLDFAIQCSLGKSRSNIYITNAFPFIKKNKKFQIPFKDYDRARRDFLEPLITIIQPKFLICAGDIAAKQVQKVLPSAEGKPLCDGELYQANGATVIKVIHPSRGVAGWNAVAEAWKTLHN